MNAEGLFFICYDDKGRAFGRGVLLADRGPQLDIQIIREDGSYGLQMTVTQTDAERWMFFNTCEELNAAVARLQAQHADGNQVFKTPSIDCGTFDVKGKENGK
jgi:hypothetical protein